MHRLTVVPVVALLSLAALAGCKKDPEPEAIPVPSAAAPASVAPAESAAPTAAASGSEAAPTTPPPANTAPVVHASIDACCSALAAIQKSGKDAATKKKASQASRVCPGIAARVKSGQVSRSAALTQVLSAMTGATIPSACH
jgi:hypothetical protein